MVTKTVTDIFLVLSGLMFDRSINAHPYPFWNMPRLKQNLRAFISYSTKDKVIACELKEVLDHFGIFSFLAHEDIQVSQEWKRRIIYELKRCDIFIALLSKSFKESNWAPQELGMVCSRRKVLIIPLQIDSLVPFGFIDHLQGVKVKEGMVSKELFVAPLIKKFPRQMISGVITRLEGVRTFRSAEEQMAPIVPFYKLMNRKEINRFADISIKNNQIWPAFKCCDEFLPAFIKKHKKRIKKKSLKILNYQIQKQEAYPVKKLEN